MLILRRAQIEEFIAPDEKELTSVVSGAIRAANGARVSGYSDKQLAAMVEKGIERARARGLTFAEDIAAFVAIMFEVAPRFDEQPQINGMLEDKTLPLNLNLELIFARGPEDAWADAQKKYEDSFWFGE